MLALYFKNGQIREKEIERPRVGRGEALVKVRYAGICSTDLEILKGYMDFSGVPGHEFVGIVETPRSLSGRRVTGEINVSCGSCELCRRGLGKHCRKRTVLGIDGRDGAFADKAGDIRDRRIVYGGQIHKRPSVKGCIGQRRGSPDARRNASLGFDSY